jgi:SsrA-binding protein
MAKKEVGRKPVAQNRKAFHEYFVEERFEAGIILHGSEVKSLREGRATIAEAHAGEMNGELWLFNAYIPEFHGANRFNHEVRRPRKLLMRRREVDRLMGAVQRKGMTLVPLSLYFSDRGWAKVELGLAKGKQLHDKRAASKDRDWQREKERLVRSSHRDAS